jgi:hypothetical protein
MKHRINKRHLRTRRNHGENKTKQNGSGLFSSIASLLVAEKTGVLNRIKNAIPNSDDNARPGFIGERHAILKLKNGLTGIANFMGPGTRIEERIARGDPPRTLSDKTAQAHDLRYFKAKTTDDIRVADKTMIEALKRIKASNGDSRFNIAQGQKLIQLKMKLEDNGIFNKGSFGELNKAMNRLMTPAMNEKLNELKQQGFGIASQKEKETDPIELLRKKMARYAKLH